VFVLPCKLQRPCEEQTAQLMVMAETSEVVQLANLPTEIR